MCNRPATLKNKKQTPIWKMTRQATAESLSTVVIMTLKEEEDILMETRLRHRVFGSHSTT